MWQNMEKQWKSTQQYSVEADSRFNEYTYRTDNPYSEFPLTFLADTFKHQNLTESILALEAAVQQDSTNSKTWEQLGRKQQENENDFAAIAALRKAVELDPQNLDALLYLSVSYTNENYSSEAYDTLQLWIERHPKYTQLAPTLANVLPVSEKHSLITEAFTRAAISQPGRDLDEDVQTALGVLFNISTEYNKAVDCFRSAISKRPDDYQLWNKLGYA
jgi:peroxin-5